MTQDEFYFIALTHLKTNKQTNYQVLRNNNKRLPLWVSVCIIEKDILVIGFQFILINNSNENCFTFSSLALHCIFIFHLIFYLFIFSIPTNSTASLQSISQPIIFSYHQRNTSYFFWYKSIIKCIRFD